MTTIAKTELGTLLLSNIQVSKTNPRRAFDEQELKELSQSIEKHGVFQPILVRPLKKPAGDITHELVCGERRFRASKMANRVDIPVNIRSLTDDEAFELQIIENLERKDVHPLDEADAFQRMLDSKRYTIADIAAKVAKPESFVVLRLKLNDLIEPIKQDFLKNHIGVGQAAMLARYPVTDQKRVHDNSKPWEKGAPPRYSNVHELKSNLIKNNGDLKKAVFDIDDAELVKGCSACSACPKRSGFNTLLFEDMLDEDRCFDSVCFDAKVMANVEKKLNDMIMSGKDVYVIAEGYGTEPSKTVKSLMQSHGIKPLRLWDDYHPNDRTGYTKGKALHISGYKRGKLETVFLAPKATAKPAAIPAGKTAEICAIETEIANMKTRANRALEIDAEKVFAGVQEIKKTDYVLSTAPLTAAERMALFVSMHERYLGYSSDQYRKIFGKVDVAAVNTTEVTDEMLNILFRKMYLNDLAMSAGTSHLSSVKAAAYKRMMDDQFPYQVNALQLAQDEIAAKRIERSVAKLKAAENKLAKLTETAPAKKSLADIVPDGNKKGISAILETKTSKKKIKENAS